MLCRLSLLLRLLAAPSLCVALVAFPVSAYAEDDEEEEDDEEGGEGEEGEEDEDKEDKDQPPVTAGGLYTLATYPVREYDRPLSITQNIFEADVGIAFDLSEGQTFETGSLIFNGRYGIRDNIEVEAGGTFVLFAPEGFPKPGLLTVAGEFAIVYDVVDFRVALDLQGLTDATTVSFGFGFPLKLAFSDKVKIRALDRIFTINTDGRKPDLTVSVAGYFQVVDVLAAYLRASVNLPEFDTGNLMTVPAAVGVQFSPNGKFDLGAEFILGNLKVEDPATPFDSRFLNLYLRGRFGK